jgi:chromosome segregation ATPase
VREGVLLADTGSRPFLEILHHCLHNRAEEVNLMGEDRTQQLPDDSLRQILARFDSMNARFDSMDARFDTMDARLTALEDKVDRRLQETRPIWEQVLDRLTNVEERLTGVEEQLTKVEERLTGVETRLEKVEDEIDALGRKFQVFNRDILKLQNRDDDLAERMDKIEAEHTR